MSSPPTTDLVLELPATAEAPVLARRAVETLDLDQTQVPTVTLLASEVVTNAVRHAAATRPIRLRATIRHRRLRVCVNDSGRGFLAPRRPQPTGERGGYGLFLVERLACRWGVSGTTVWFELPAGR